MGNNPNIKYCRLFLSYSSSNQADHEYFRKKGIQRNVDIDNPQEAYILCKRFNGRLKAIAIPDLAEWERRSDDQEKLLQGLTKEELLILISNVQTSGNLDSAFLPKCQTKQ